MNFATLLDIPGIYVVRFPDRVKVGRATKAWSRLRTHLLAGATDAVVFEVPLAVTLLVGGQLHPHSTPTRPLQIIEAQAIAALHQVATVVPGTRESFTGIEFRDTVRIVRDLSATRRREVEFPNLAAIDGALRSISTHWATRRNDLDTIREDAA